MTDRAFNFNAGPGTLPMPALQQAARDILDYQGLGLGIMEMSHRSKEFMAIAEQTESLFRELLGIPNNYRILFLQGGASSQFFMVPMNLLAPGTTACYLNTGTWSAKAIKEARRFGTVDVPFSGEADNFRRLPEPTDYTVAHGCQYLYLVSNNTIFGTQFSSFPETDVMLVADMSSDILSRRIPVERFGLIFAGAQKNLGPAGVTIVIVRDDLLDRVADSVPTMLRYKTHADKQSMYNTPPCFAVYLVGEVLKWVKAQGGVEAIEQRNEEKARLIYEMIDSGDYYRGHAEPSSRSRMNVVFNLPTAELEAKFVAAAAKEKMIGLKGHRSVGGCRASIYNAFPVEGVRHLVAFMQRFERENPA
ncbi:MAG: 3-phosphoserine/phosphohydroxythreonine transaminase [Desulfofustis sp.]|jgi:phosphoserine aminotransferase|nr:3-phosphoserine/phosphohydroxythreonine transaminase [Desulfofustis sp.]